MKRGEILYDCVINPNLEIIFKGTPEETKKYLLETPRTKGVAFRVVVGKTLTLVKLSEYLRN